MEPDRILFAHGWRFALTQDEAALLPAYDDSAWRKVTLPHDWQIDQPRSQDAPGKGCQGFYPREHMGVYRLRFQADQGWRHQQVRILFDGVQRFSEVWLNGVQVGGHAYGYVPFTVDISRALDFAKDNVLAVKVDNRSAEGEYAASGEAPRVLKPEAQLLRVAQRDPGREHDRREPASAYYHSRGVDPHAGELPAEESHESPQKAAQKDRDGIPVHLKASPIDATA